LDHFLGQRMQRGFGAQREAKAFHSSNKAALAMANSGELFRQAFVAPAEMGPAAQFMNEHRHSPHILRILWGLFSAMQRIPPRPNSGLPEFGTLRWPKSDTSDLGWGGWPPNEVRRPGGAKRHARAQAVTAQVALRDSVSGRSSSTRSCITFGVI